ncbi:MAG: hypothetical protein JNM98_06005 [Rhodocyclaceae bacterium]|nr:hypothetical protein [Rhodocyclaceae bacterium]
MSDPCLWANEWVSTLAADASAGSTSVVVSDSAAQVLIDRLAAPAGMSPLCYLTLGAADPREVVQVTGFGAAVAGMRTITVVRGRDGTAATAWPSGTQIGLYVPRAALESLRAGAWVPAAGALDVLDLQGDEAAFLYLDLARPLWILRPHNGSEYGVTITLSPPSGPAPAGWVWRGQIVVAPVSGSVMGPVQILAAAPFIASAGILFDTVTVSQGQCIVLHVWAAGGAWMIDGNRY